MHDKMASDALNMILKMFEELARVFSQINAPTVAPQNQPQGAAAPIANQEGAPQPAPDAADNNSAGGALEPIGDAPTNQQELEGRVASVLANLNAQVDSKKC